MQTLEEYRNQLLAFLHVEQNLARADKEKQKQMSREEKIEASVLLIDISVTRNDGDIFILHVPDNYSKLRAGDNIIIRKEGGTDNHKAIVLDNLLDSMTISTNAKLDQNQKYEIEIESLELLQSLIGCLEGISAGKPGAALLRVLAQEDSIETEEFLRININEIKGFAPVIRTLNAEQQKAVQSMLEFPQVHVLQGPPGTGKTQVLAAAAIASSKVNREVVVIANTHHAVNNALLKIHQMDSSIPVFKIGEQLKAEELGDAAITFRRFTEYSEYAWKIRKKKRLGHVVGMTIWGAITNLGLHQHSYFRPYIALVDESSQMPLTYASILGKCAPSVCLFGDSRQMPPIYRPELAKNPLCVSVLDYCYDTLRAPTVTLSTTYRMNDVITKFVSSHFYEPHGITLHSNNQSLAGDDSIKWIDTLSLPNALDDCVEQNEVEATAIAREVSKLLAAGTKAEDIAVITPYRKQVIQLRTAMEQEGIDRKMMPLVDTVERLQGQDVDYIFISFATSVRLSDLSIDQCEFLLNPNRINVMISRAKSFVRIYSTKQIHDAILKIG